jgi:GTP cyclohydrolase I
VLPLDERIFWKHIVVLESMAGRDHGTNVEGALGEQMEDWNQKQTVGQAIAFQKDCIWHHHLAPKMGVMSHAYVPTTNGSRSDRFAGRNALREIT